jgi:hypothetical protein
MVYIKNKARWYAYGFAGPATGVPGTGGSLAAGPVWYVEEPGDYEGWFFTTTLEAVSKFWI